MTIWRYIPYLCIINNNKGKNFPNRPSDCRGKKIRKMKNYENEIRLNQEARNQSAERLQGNEDRIDEIVDAYENEEYTKEELIELLNNENEIVKKEVMNILF